MDGGQRIAKPRPDTSHISGHRAEGELDNRSVENAQREGAGMVSGISRPFTSAKNLFARKVYTSQEVELRADRQHLEDPQASDADRADVLSDIRSKLESGDQLSARSEKELFRMAEDTKIRPEDRLEIIDMLSRHFDAPYPDALLDGMCRLMSEGLDPGESQTKLMGTVAFILGNEASDPPTRRQLTILSKMAKSLEKCPDEKLNAAVVLNVCRGLDQFAQDEGLVGAHAKSLVKDLSCVVKLYQKVAANTSFSPEDRMHAAKQLFKISTPGRYGASVRFERASRSGVLGVMAEILKSMPEDQRMQEVKGLFFGEDVRISSALVSENNKETRHFFGECLLILANDKLYAAEHRDAMNSVFVALNRGGGRDLEALAFSARFDVAFAKNEHLPLRIRLEHERAVLDPGSGHIRAIHQYGFPEDVPREVSEFENQGGVVLRECVQRMGQDDAPFAERMEAFKILRDENKIGGGPQNTLRGVDVACSAFLDAALQEGNRAQFEPSELLALCAHSSNVAEALTRLIACEDIPINGKEVVQLASEKLNTEGYQAVLENLIKRDDLSVEDRVYVVKQGVDAGNEACRMELSKLRRKANMPDTPIAERLQIAEALQSNGIEDVVSIYKRISVDSSVDVGSRIEALRRIVPLDAGDKIRLVELLVEGAKAEQLPLSPRAMVHLVMSKAGERHAAPVLGALVGRSELTVADRVYIAAKGAKIRDEACRIELTKIKQRAFDSETPPSVRMAIAGALAKNREQGADGIYVRLIDDESVDAMTRIRAANALGRDAESRIASLLVDKLLSDDLSNGVVESAAIYRALRGSKLLNSYDQNKIIDHFKVEAAKSSDPRIQVLLPIFFEGFSRSEDPESVLTQAMAVMESDDYTLEEKYVLAFLPIAKVVGADVLLPDSPGISDFLSLGRRIFADPSALPEGFLSKADFVNALEAMDYCASLLKLPEDDIHREVIKDIEMYRDNAGFMQRRAQSVVHNPIAARFSGEGVAALNVKWNPGYIAKPLPRPDVPDVSYQDFQDWAAAYEAEIKGSDAALAEMKLMTDSRDLSFFMGDAKRKEFETYLDPSRVEGAFIDSKALALRRVVAHAQTLSDVPEPGEAISPRGKLFQQLLVNCRTCSTGFMDAVVVVDREIRNESAAQDADFTEAGMREQRKVEAFEHDYYQASVERRQKMLDGDSVFTRTLAEENPNKRLNQPVHQSWAVNGVLGKRVGVHVEGDRFEVDEYALIGNNVNKKIYNADPQAALDMFYEHYDVKAEVAHFKDLWNEQMASDLKKVQDLKVAKDASIRLQVLNGKAEAGGLSAAEQKERETLQAKDWAAEIKAIEDRPSYNTFEKIQALMGSGSLGEIFDYDYDEDTDEDIYTLNDRGVAMILVKMGALEVVE